MKILHLIPYMHPSAGGPPVVVDRWCVELQKLGIEAHVLTTDAYDDGSSPDWIEQYRSRYPIDVCALTGPRGFGFSSKLRSRFLELLPTVDLVHVHNLWGYSNQLAAKYCPKYSVPFVVSTHGMLDPHSLGRKSWKKRLYGSHVEWPAIRKAAGVVFTHQEEERLARTSCKDLPTGHIVSLGTEDPPDVTREVLAEQFLSKHPECRGRRLVTFLGRLHSKKGLDLLIPAMKSVIDANPDAMLVLVGPGEPDYVSSLNQLCERLGISESTVFVGSVAGIDKWEALAAASVFALPSYQENFAIALVEALRIGTPAVISNRVNIWEDLLTAGAAVCCELTVDSVADKICESLDSSEKLKVMSSAGRSFSAANYTWPLSAGTLKHAYSLLLSSENA